MFKVYFDGIEQNEKDIININDVAEFTIIREDGFSSDEQILRDKTEMDLQFCGGAYSYICNKIATDRCNEIEFRIEDTESELFYNGIIPVTLCELDLSKNIGKTKIKDNSFSAFIRDYLNVDVSLFNSKTVNCENLETTLQSFRMKKTYNNDTDVIIINAYDVLDVFKFLINYFTDNTIDVVSTFLSNNRYAITTGFNMHNYAGSSDEIYPTLNIATLFEELRKKLNLYTSIEYDVANRPYLRIEEQSYFFSNTVPLFNIDEIPHGTIQTYDIDRDFNQINIGSTTFQVQSGSPVTFPQKRFIAWNDETYTSCGTCTGLKDSSLELVSDYIIDSNVIYEALNWGSTDYENDSSIFLFNYTTSSGFNLSFRTLVSGEYHYNNTLINENVLSNWIDYYGACISIARYPANGFMADYINYPLTVSGGFGSNGVSDVITYANTVYDLETVLSSYAGNASLPSNILGPAAVAPITATYFEAPVSANYILQFELVRFLQTSKPTFPTQLDVQLQLITYTDNTFATIINTYELTDSTPNAVTTPTSIILNTSSIALSAGNCAITKVIFKDYSGNIRFVGGNFDFNADNAIFRMISDGTCLSIGENNQDSKPFVLNFEYPLCFSDYQTAKENKRGYIDITGKRYWIKELIYRHNRNSSLKLMGNYSLCGC